jgi:hypothetical protein
MSTKLRAVLTCLLLAWWSAGCTHNGAPAPSTATPPIGLTFESTIYSGGSISQSFTVSNSGFVTANLVSTTPFPAIVVGLGIGIPLSTGTCSLSSSVNAAAGPNPQLVVPVDSGSYCVEIFDNGNIASPVSFIINIAHP